MSALIPLFFLLVRLNSAVSSGILSQRPLVPLFYSKTCPNAENIVRCALKEAMGKEARVAASLQRLSFHDCFVQGCDASLLLNDTADMLGEKLSLSNINSLRSYEVVDEIKERLERECPGVVSCADIITIVGRDAVVLSGGPNWIVTLGRLDSLSASQITANEIMPSPRANASSLINLFRRFNLTTKDMVVLSAAHSIGYARCFSVLHRLYNQTGTGQADTAMDRKYLIKLKKICPKGGDQNTTVRLDYTPEVFDNQYFKQLVQKKGFLNSDQTLHTSSETKQYVELFSKNQTAFFESFVLAMIKMASIQSREDGEIRKICSMVNPKSKTNFTF